MKKPLGMGKRVIWGRQVKGEEGRSLVMVKMVSVGGTDG